MHFMLLELDTHHCHLDFKQLDESNYEIIPTTFYLQLLNKEIEVYTKSIYEDVTRCKINLDLNPTTQ